MKLVCTETEPDFSLLLHLPQQNRPNCPVQRWGDQKSRVKWNGFAGKINATRLQSEREGAEIRDEEGQMLGGSELRTEAAPRRAGTEGSCRVVRSRELVS